jgi:hypothetical protein
MRTGRIPALFVPDSDPRWPCRSLVPPTGAPARNAWASSRTQRLSVSSLLIIAAPSRLNLAPWPCGDQTEDIVPRHKVYPRGVGFQISGCEPEPYKASGWGVRSRPVGPHPPPQWVRESLVDSDQQTFGVPGVQFEAHFAAPVLFDFAPKGGPTAWCWSRQARCDVVQSAHQRTATSSERRRQLGGPVRPPQLRYVPAACHAVCGVSVRKSRRWRMGSAGWSSGSGCSSRRFCTCADHNPESHPTAWAAAAASSPR